VGGAKPRSIENLYYNGGGNFRIPETPSKDVEVLATYGDTNQVAAVVTKNGKGKAVLCSVHFEYPLHDPPARDAIHKQENPPSADEIDHSEKERIEFAEDILLLLGLKPPKRNEAKGHAVHGDEDPELLFHPTHPSPIFILNHPDLAQLGSASFEPPALRAKLEQGESEAILRDGNDEIHVVSVDTVAAEGEAAGVAAYLASKRRTKPVFPPPVEQLSVEPSTTTPEPPQMPDLNALPKFILTSSEKIDYTPRWTPLFNFETYWQEIDAARKRVGRKSGVMRSGNKLALGDLVWYAEAITSTQTILDR
jgi:biotin--protein ligase